MNGSAPVYLTYLVTKHEPRRSLRSQSKSLLTVSHTRPVTYGDRCFRKSAALLWNKLPEHVKNAKTILTFKKNLKPTFLKLHMSYSSSPLYDLI